MDFKKKKKREAFLLSYLHQCILTLHVLHSVGVYTFT